MHRSTKGNAFIYLFSFNWNIAGITVIICSYLWVWDFNFLYTFNRLNKSFINQKNYWQIMKIVVRCGSTAFDFSACVCVWQLPSVSRGPHIEYQSSLSQVGCSGYTHGPTGTGLWCLAVKTQNTLKLKSRKLFCTQYFHVRSLSIHADKYPKLPSWIWYQLHHCTIITADNPL